MRSKKLSMNPRVAAQRINVRKQRLQEIFTQSRLLPFIERKSSRKVFPRRKQDFDFHNNRLRNSFLAVSQSW